MGGWMTPMTGKRILEWLILSLVGLTALVLASAHVPLTMRKLVLFPIALGAAAGALLAAARRFSGIPRTRGILATAGVLIFAVESAAPMIHWQAQAAMLRSQYADEEKSQEADERKSDVMALDVRSRVESMTPPDDPDERQSYEKLLREFRDADASRLKRKEEIAQKKQESLGLPAYLANRVLPLGKWPEPWPALFWGLEMALGIAVGLAVFRRVSAGVTPTPQSGPTAATPASSEPTVGGQSP